MRNDKKVKQNGWEPRFYYIRSQNSRAVATVCLIQIKIEQWGSIFVRGAAFCDPHDQFVRKVGRAKALGRAIQAIERPELTIMVPPKFYDWFTAAPARLGHYDVRLTDHELRMYQPRLALRG